MVDIKSFPNNQDEYIGAEPVMRWLHGRTSGVFGEENNAAVSAVPGTMSVSVSDGIGWISNDKGNGVVWWNDSESETGNQTILVIDPADGALSRIDRVVVTWETTNYVARPTISILKGSNASNPVPPSLTNNNLQRQISLARVSVPAGTISLSAPMVTDERLDPSVCGIVTETIKVDTSTMQSQFESLLKAIQSELKDLEAGTGLEFKRLQFTDVIVSKASFVADTTYSDFPFRAGVQLYGVLETMTPEVIFGVADATSGNFAPVSESYTGGIYLYAESVPESDITIPTIICWR